MKKRVISLLLALVLAVSLLPTAAGAAEVKEISTPEQFARMDVDGNYILKQDITVEEPYASDFSGTFDGNGCTITLAITGDANANNGLFRQLVGGAIVKNIVLEGTLTQNNNKSSTGAVAGKANSMNGNIVVENCSSEVAIVGYNKVGGIIGEITGSSHGVAVQSCANLGNISGRNTAIGGIIGSSSGTGHITSYCYNRGNITGFNYAGGIVGQCASKISSSYSTGDVNLTSTRNNKGDIFGGGKALKENCFSADGSDGSNIAEVANLISSDKFVADENNINNGYPILSWQKTSGGGKPEPPKPGISISGTKTLWTVAGGKNVTQTTLTVSYAGMGDEKPAVTWNYPSESDAAAFTTAENNSGALVVNALGKTGGTATVTATVTYNGESYSDSVVITVIPNITSVAVKDAATGYDTTYAGATVKAHIYTGGSELDPAFAGLVSYQWYSYDSYTTKYEKLDRETGETYQISENFSANQILVEVRFGGETACAYQDSKAAHVTTGAAARLEADKAALTLEKLGVSSTTITAETTLTLPKVGKNGSSITWESSDSSVIDPTTGEVTLPAEGEQKVTLTAKLTLNDSTGKLPREFTIKSKAAQAVDADKETLEKAAKALSVLYPTFGKDSNVQTMVETRLANAGFSGVGVKFISAEPTIATAVQAASAISSIGGITYFYDDPNKTVNERTQWFDTYKAYFTLTCGSETQENVAVPVTVYWDVNRVCRVMTEEVLDRVTLPELTEGNLNLPTAVEGKQWTKIVWTSSDPGIISNGGVVTRSAIDRQTVLTASFTFQRTNDVTGSEPPIVLYKVFEVTVKGNADAADRAALYRQKLNDALAAPGLKDFVTGEKLTADANGVYTTSNDIQFPTTRDLKIDGKYTPVVITSSDPGVIEAPTTPNSARVWVYRPLPGESAKTVTLTMKILDRPSGPQPGDDLSAMRGVLASEEIKVTVQPLTQTEIDAEIALMERVKDAYWDGIRNANTDQNNVTTNLHAFQKCYLGTDRQLTWVYDRNDLKNQGIVPVPLDNWYDLQIWRLFRSSNADVIAHENLLVTRQNDSKAVTITSYLSSETLGRYAEKYPQNAEFQKLYQQPVTVDLVVTGTKYAQGGDSTVRKEAASYALSNRAMLTVDFTLTGRGMGFSEPKLEYAEGSTAFDVFSDMLAKHGYTCKRRGSYIAAITSDSGVTLEEFDEGKNSGWMYRVNGELVRRYMSAQGLNDGDRIELYFTSDWTSEPGAEGWQKPGKIETIVNADGSVTKIETKSDGTVIETTTWRDGSTLTVETSPNGRVETVEKRADGTTVETVESASGGITASVSVPKSVGSTRVDIPVSKPSGSMVAVIVHPDGTEEIVKGSVVTETGIALRAEGDVRLKVIDNAKRFNDMANHWAKDAVEFASSRELFNGVGNDAFGPDLSMTRGMVSTVLARLAGADTAGGETWYAKGTAWAVENGISDGTAPEQPVTREQLAAMLYRYAGSPAVSGELGFDDADSISAWARDAVRWCVDNGILNGVGGNRMTPQDLARRGQVAAMLMRFLQATV